MSSPRHSCLEEIFIAAMDMNAGERTRYIDEQCAGDPELRREVEKLINADRQPTGSLLEPKPMHIDTVDQPLIGLGTTIGSYQICEKLDEGGMGLIFVARHETLGNRVAIKVLRRSLSANQDMSQRFMNEAKAAANIGHPGIVKVFDAGRHENGDLYIIMELLQGESLKYRLKWRHTLDERTAVSFIRQAARALAAAHKHGFVHRDLKPDNMFLVLDPEVTGGERVKLLDFGIAKLIRHRTDLVTKTNVLMGTPPYMSPEQCRGAGKVDHRTDLYSLGVILYEMLCGRWPFVKDGLGEYTVAHMHEPPPAVTRFNPDVSPRVAAVVHKLLAKQPDQRYWSADALVEALDAATDMQRASLTGLATRQQTNQDAVTVHGRGSMPHLNNTVSQQSTEPAPPATQSPPRLTHKHLPPPPPEHLDYVPSLSAMVKGVANHTGTAGATRAEGEQAMNTTMSQAAAVVTSPKLRSLARQMPAGGLGAVAVATALAFVINSGIIVDRSHPPDTTRRSGTTLVPTPTGPGKILPPAVEFLGQRAFSELREWIDSGNADVCSEVINALQNVATPRGGELLFRALDSGPQQVRLEAAQALVTLRWPDAAPKIRTAMEMSAGPLRIQLAAYLLALGDRDGKNMLESELAKNGNLAVDAAVALARFANHDKARIYLKQVLGETPVGRDRWYQAAAGLLAEGDAGTRARLTAELAQSDPQRALESAKILARGGNTTAIDYLQRVAKQQNFALRGEAALILASVNNPAALDFAAEVFAGMKTRDTKHGQARDRQIAVLIAGRLRRAGGMSYAREIKEMAQNDDDRRVRIAAHAALLAFADNNIN